MPGVVTHHTNVVEHPELVAQRLVRLANVVGRERVMGGTDCGFAQGAFTHRVHEEIQWAKLASLVEGARSPPANYGARRPRRDPRRYRGQRHFPGDLRRATRSQEETKVRRHRRTGYAGIAALAVATLAAAGCSSSSSSSAASPAASAAAPASAAAAPSASGSAGGLGAQSVTNYLSYTGGKSGPANSSLTPVTVGFVNQQGGPQVIGQHATDGAEMAVNYINKELGGVDGHPIKLDTCFIASAEEEGTGCAQKFLAEQVRRRGRHGRRGDRRPVLLQHAGRQAPGGRRRGPAPHRRRAEEHRGALR